MNSTFFKIALLALLLTSASVTFAQQADSKTVSAPATVKAFQTVDLYAKVSGYISEMDVDIGDAVKKGQPLLKLHVPELQQQLAQKMSQIELAKAQAAQALSMTKEVQAQLEGFEAAVKEAETKKTKEEAGLKYYKLELQRVTELAKRGAIQSQLVDRAQFELQAAEAGINMADAAIARAKANLVGAKAAVSRAQSDEVAAKAKIQVAQADAEYVKELVNYTTITAPFDGYVTERMYDAGAFVQNADGNGSAKPILQVVKTDVMRIVFSLSMSDIAGLDRGDKVTLSNIDALQGETFEGTVTRFSAGLDAESRMMKVEMDLDNSQGKLRPGYFGYVTLYPE